MSELEVVSADRKFGINAITLLFAHRLITFQLPRIHLISTHSES
jgi:hypothetical protein